MANPHSYQIIWTSQAKKDLKNIEISPGGNKCKDWYPEKS